MFGLGLEAVALHSRVSLLPSTMVLSRGYVVCNEGESKRRQRLLVSSVKCRYDINAKTECTDWNISEIVYVAGAWKFFCKKERSVFLPRTIHSFLRPLLPGACLAGHISETEISVKKKKEQGTVLNGNEEYSRIPVRRSQTWKRWRLNWSEMQRQSNVFQKEPNGQR